MPHTPTPEPALTDVELRAWFAARGVADTDLDEFVAEHRGATESDMDELADRVNGRMA